jgi:hypothetical protein
MWKGIKFIAGVIAGFFCIIGALVVGKKVYEYAKLKKVSAKKNFSVVNETAIAITDNEGYIEKVVQLPVNPKTGKQVLSKEVVMAGYSKGGKVHVEIKHNIINRNGAIGSTATQGK